MPKSTKEDDQIVIEVFRSGTFTPMAGKAISYSADDLESIVTGYDPENSPAPVVVGHPTTDAPAYAWVTGFEYDKDADRLFASIGEVQPAFAEAVREGRYKKVSMSFHCPDASNNPTPGNWYPKHIGFLGAAAPAVSGLAPIQFQGKDSEAVTFEASFGEAGFEDAASLFRGIRDFFIEKFGLEDADKVLPAYRLEWLSDTEVKTPELKSSYFVAPTPKEPDMTPEQIAALEARERKNKEQEASFAERVAVMDKREAEARDVENVSFAEGLVKAGKLLPASQANAVAILGALSVDQTVSFSEGKSELLVDALKSLLEAQPIAVDFSETDLGDDHEGGVMSASFASDGKPVDTSQLEVDAKAKAFMTKNPGVEYIAAVTAVS